MSLIRRFIGRRFCTAVIKQAEEIMPNPDCRPSELCFRVGYLAGACLDTAAKYARLAAFSRGAKRPNYNIQLTCEGIIRAMVHEKRHKDANELYDFFFRQHKLRPTAACCNLMIESRFQEGLVDEALEFHRSVKPFGKYPQDETFRILVKWLVYHGRLDQAEAFVTEMRAGDTNHPDHVAFNYLIRGFLALGNSDKANLVLDEFKRSWSSSSSVLATLPPHPFGSYPPMHSEYENRVVFLMATFMEDWFKRGKEKEAMECFNRYVLADNKLRVCRETGEALLEILLRYGQKKHAWALFYDHYNSGTVRKMVDECFETGRCSQAIEIYNKAGDISEYIIARCCQNGMLSEAESFFADILTNAPAYLSDSTFTTMIDAYLKAGRVQDAVETSNKLVDLTLKEISLLF